MTIGASGSSSEASQGGGDTPGHRLFAHQAKPKHANMIAVNQPIYSISDMARAYTAPHSLTSIEPPWHASGKLIAVWRPISADR